MQTATISDVQLVGGVIDNQVSIADPTKDFPLLIRPTETLDFKSWAAENQAFINEMLLKFGAILFRGFNIHTAKEFSDAFQVISGEALEYKNRTSPRERVYDNVYTSTSHPKDQKIHMHTENSYSPNYNQIIAFFCLIQPTFRGQTPIADERKILSVLKPDVLEKFREKGIKYVRNSMLGVGLDWKTIFQTEDKTEVNAFLEANHYEYAWIGENHLRMKWVLPAFQRHPETGEEMWFNHMYFGHKSLYHPGIIEFFQEENLPLATYYGDGSAIEDEVIAAIGQFYEEESIVFNWEKGDFLLLDNMMYAHGRMPFKGERKILTAMGRMQRMV